MNNEEKTLVLIKPDGVKRGLIGEIISRIEKRGLKIVSLEMIWARREQVDRHYPKTREWIERIGQKTMANYQKHGLDLHQELGLEDPYQIGQVVRGWLIDYMVSGPMVKVVVSGNHAIEMVRQLAGDTMPAQAQIGTIRGDFSIDDAARANREKRSIRNIIHASENPEEAENELNLWTSAEDVFDYHLPVEEVM
ncbi:MAG TPA: nucleoside-diphosphate kinase [Candidatus Pacearchaeota archaeon]|nr:nucleoside-diphosphate kinase [Candidatus Pacearchaeota archaeon]